MPITIKCTSMDKAYCPVCCSKNIVNVKGKGGNPHCGICGTELVLEFTEPEGVPQITPEEQAVTPSEGINKKKGKEKSTEDAQISIFDIL